MNKKELIEIAKYNKVDKYLFVSGLGMIPTNQIEGILYARNANNIDISVKVAGMNYIQKSLPLADNTQLLEHENNLVTRQAVLKLFNNIARKSAGVIINTFTADDIKE